MSSATRALPDPIDDELLQRALDTLFGDWDRRAGLRDAAVLIPWFAHPDGDRILFTRRPDDIPTHAGQLAFPGGIRERGETPLQTALREADEEVGLRPEEVAPLGALPPRLSSSGFRVHAVVARITGTEHLAPCPREVAALVEFPVAELADPNRWRLEQPPGLRRPLPHFRRDGQVLWGMTARLTLDLIARLRAAAV